MAQFTARNTQTHGIEYNYTLREATVIGEKITTPKLTVAYNKTVDPKKRGVYVKMRMVEQEKTRAGYTTESFVGYQDRFLSVFVLAMGKRSDKRVQDVIKLMEPHIEQLCRDYEDGNDVTGNISQVFTPLMIEK